jgi:hypothetical protein
LKAKVIPFNSNCKYLGKMNLTNLAAYEIAIPLAAAEDVATKICL